MKSENSLTTDLPHLNYFIAHKCPSDTRISGTSIQIHIDSSDCSVVIAFLAIDSDLRIAFIDFHYICDVTIRSHADFQQHICRNILALSELGDGCCADSRSLSKILAIHLFIIA